MWNCPECGEKVHYAEIRCPKCEKEISLGKKSNEGIHIAEELEKEGKIDEAIKCYEMIIDKNFSGNRPYDRLTIIYRKRKQLDDEIRVLEKAMEVFTYIATKTPRRDGAPKLIKYVQQYEKAKNKKLNAGDYSHWM